MPLPAGHHFTHARKAIRTALAQAGISTEIDALVAALLDGASE